MKKSKLNITDLRKLKIKKVSNFKLLFEYDGREYIIINDSGDDCHISLYERIWVKKDASGRKQRCILEHVAGEVTCRTPIDFIKDISKRHPKNITYSNIDREYFVKMLAEMNFVGGKYTEEYKKLKEEQDKINEEIRKLQREVSELYKDWRKPSGHGSKQPVSTEFLINISERVVGAKTGDWCEEHKAKYGSVHSEYGGELVDLFSLPVGTNFYVNNGSYDAVISVDEHGDKCILTAKSFVKLTKEHHSAYISQVI